ncbi:hypothetical protein K438DRAFT_1959345 [Mycena galopus ATCC 62051]|nr:hypothetical protein K438DRAFT_1959345 [Mycena galopus ATCC 62051]
MSDSEDHVHQLANDKSLAREDQRSDDEPSDDGAPPRRKCRVVDFTIQDSEWEDEPEGTLPGLGTTTHRSCNPQLLANPRRKQRRRVVAGPNEGINRLDVLAADLNAWEVECEQRVHELAEKHGMKPKEVRRRMLALSTYGARHKPSTYNAKISQIMADLNAGPGLGVGERYTIPEVKLMVSEDPSMLEGFSKKDVKKMIKEVLAKREAKGRGTRANNLAAAADAKHTMDCLMLEITSLAKRSWGVLDFFWEVLKRDPVDMLNLFELWAVSRKQGKTKKNKLLAMQQEATGTITTGLQTILGITKCTMNYESYIEKLVWGKGVALVNWPEGVDFKCMSLQSAVGPLEKLLDSLKCRTTRWKVLMAAEKKKLIEQYEEMLEQGEVKVKEKAGKSRTTKPRKATKVVMVEDEEEEEEGEDDDDEPPPRKMAAKRKRKAAPKLSPRDEHRGDDNDDEPPPHKTAANCKRPKLSSRDEHSDEDDKDEPPPRKTAPKRKRKAAPKPSPRDQHSGEDDDDDLPPRKTTRPKVSSKPNPRAGLKPATMQEKLQALVQKGRDANDKAKLGRKAARSEKDGEAEGEDEGRQERRKRKRTKENDADGGRKARKKKRAAEEEEGGCMPVELPRPKPLHRGKRTTAPTATSVEEGGSTRGTSPDGPTDGDPHDDSVSGPASRFVFSGGGTTPSIAASTTSTRSGWPNTVRGSGKGGGPPGVKVW